MARRLAGKPIVVKKKVDPADEPGYFERQTTGGPKGRGNPEGTYMCSACEQNKHALCEKHKCIFCGCYRYKHKVPTDNKIKGLREDLTDGNVRITPSKKKVSKPVPVEDEFDWDDA